MKTYLFATALCLIAAPAFASFSSLALSPKSGAWGKSHDFDSRERADSTALGYCQAHAKNPDDCRVVNWSKGGWCSAVAVRHKPDGSVEWGSGSGASLEAARAKAYSNCPTSSGRCNEILADVCSR